MYCIFGGVIKKWSFVLLGRVIQQWNVILACLKCLVGVMGEVLGGSVRALAGGFRCSAPRKKKKKCSHCKRCARAKARVRKWRRQALPVALVVRCRRRPRNKPPPLVPTTEPVWWKWKKRKVGLDSVTSRLKSSTLNSFCAANHDFLRLPQLLSTLCNHNYHVKQIE